jgi:Tfp pilus assembly protein PilZ
LTDKRKAWSRDAAKERVLTCQTSAKIRAVLTELVAIFDRLVGAQWIRAEEFILSWPVLFPARISQCDLAFRSSTHTLLAVARFHEKGFGPDIESRFQFWTAHTGGRAFSTHLLGEKERALFRKQLLLCDVREPNLPLDKLPEALSRVAKRTGAPQDIQRLRKVTLNIDLGRSGELAIIEDTSDDGVFVVSLMSPPMGDKLQLNLRIPGCTETFSVEARVAHARGPAHARPRAPAGFGLQFLSPPPALSPALKKYFATPQEGPERRTSYRHPVTAPVRITPVERVAPPEPVSIAYEDARDAQDDYVKNLSHGGAYVRTTNPLPLHTRVVLDFSFPKGLKLRALGKVVHAHESGMGIQFELDAVGKAELNHIIERISATRRRALVVDADAQYRQALRTELAAQNFEVLDASTPQQGLHLLIESLLELDAIVVRKSLPHVGAQSLPALIRRAGGENDLVLVLVDDDPNTPSGDVSLDACIPFSAGPKAIASSVLHACLVKKNGRTP